MRKLLIWFTDSLPCILLVVALTISFVFGIDRYAALYIHYDNNTKSTHQVADVPRPAVPAIVSISRPPYPPDPQNNSNDHNRPGNLSGVKTVSGLAFVYVPLEPEE